MTGQPPFAVYSEHSSMPIHECATLDDGIKWAKDYKGREEDVWIWDRTSGRYAWVADGDHPEGERLP